MCKKLASTSIAGWPKQIWKRSEKSRPSNAGQKRIYLITDDGFGSRLVANLAFMAITIYACYSNDATRDFAVDTYYDVKESMMRIANEMAWWSILGMLSSSCCALQILLNALSFGCAGFNNVLGPLRPTFISITIVAQICTWKVAHSRPYQWKATAMSSVLSAMLTLLPECVSWQTRKRERKTRHSKRGCSKHSGSSVDANGEIHLQFQLSSMGCSSCVATVSRVLEGIDCVIRHKVIFETGIAEVALDETSVVRNYRKSNASRGTLLELLRRDISDQLMSAGFPVDEARSKTD